MKAFEKYKSSQAKLTLEDESRKKMIIGDGSESDEEVKAITDKDKAAHAESAATNGERKTEMSSQTNFNTETNQGRNSMVTISEPNSPNPKNMKPIQSSVFQFQGHGVDLKSPDEKAGSLEFPSIGNAKSGSTRAI